MHFASYHSVTSPMRSGDIYVVAVRREQRDEVPQDWRETVRGTPGVTVRGSNPFRVQIEASPEAVAELQARLAPWCYIEKLVEHERL